MENQHILLIDTRAAEGKQRFFSQRHLIVGVSRATHQDFVHVDPSYEAILMSGARDWAKKSMGNGGENPAEYVADDYDDVNDLALYFNDPDEVPAALLASHFSPAQPAAAAADPGVDADINQFFDYEGVFEETADSDVEYYSDGDVVM